MPLRYDLLVVDLDGTLLNSAGDISPGNARAIAHARDSGLEVIIATGRSLKESRRAIEALDYDGLVVAAGGSMLCDARTGATIDRRVLPREIVKSVTDMLMDDGHKVLLLKDSDAAGHDYVVVGPGSLDPASQWWFDHLPVEVRHIDHPDEDAHPEDTLRAGAVAVESRIAPIAQVLRQCVGDRCTLQHWSAVTQTEAVGSATHLLEVFGCNVNKWTMIESHCQRRGIDPARVAAIGDGINDIELVREAGLGIAMANASAPVLSVADRLTLNHNEDGVAHAIGVIMSGEW
jgi:hydroxymethylpyrimidine pyrophosphatase-like HAD family hydrolase